MDQLIQIPTERDYIQTLRSQADETIGFFSNRKKKFRERCTCAAFLRCSGVSFLSKDIVSSSEEPPDVIFNSAQFEVIEKLYRYSQQRERHDEWKQEKARRDGARSLRDLIQPYKPPTPLSCAELTNLVTDALRQKKQKYDPRECTNLDALVYVNLKNKFLQLRQLPSNFKQLQLQGWRSVSVLIPPYAWVLFAQPSAPPFLRNLVGKIRSENTDIDGLFDLQ